MPFELKNIDNLVFDYNDYQNDCDHFELDDRHKDGLTYKKQLAYEGNFKKVNEGLEFTIDSNLLDHWKKESETMLSREVEIPLVLNHTENPEARRGDVIGFERAKDSKGREALYCLTRFSDGESAKVAKTAQVSLYSPKKVSDGSGNTYHYPIKHVAITDYPVIAGMERFQAIAASLSSSNISKENDLDIIAAFPNMQGQGNPGANPDENNSNPSNPANGNMIVQLANALGLEVMPNENESVILNKIVSAFAALKQRAGLSNPANFQGNTNMPMQRPPIAAGFLKMARENREMKLSNLVKSGKITSAAYKTLSEQFLTDDDLAFSLSDDEKVANLSGFDAVVKSLEQMPEHSALSLEERTALNADNEYILSFKKQKGDENPLLKDAESRSKSVSA